MNFVFRMIISAFLFASVANAANQIRAVRINPAPYRLYVQSIEPSLGLDLYGRERVPITLSNGTKWIATQFLYQSGVKLALLPRGVFSQCIPLGNSVSISTSSEQKRYEWTMEVSNTAFIQAKLVDGKENLLTITAHEEVLAKGDSKLLDVWELSDGSLWTSGEARRHMPDFCFTRSAWLIGDHVIISFREEDINGKLLDTPCFWMLNADYDWYTPAYGGQKYKPYIFIAPISREEYEINID